MLKYIKFIIVPVTLLISCSDNSNPPVNNTPGSGSNSPNGWLIPQDQVFDGGPGKDGIPALLNPEHTGIDQITYLSDNDLVVGFQAGDQARAYPHKILDRHEIINDELNGKNVAITYCPLTGTGIAWDRLIRNQITTFGVSGLLYNTNLILYDRLTDSNWSQIRLDCVNGALLGDEIVTYRLVETTWKTWKEMFPNSSAVTTETGFSRNYSQYPYGDYKTNNPKLIFPDSPTDERLPGKERVLGLILNKKAKIYRFDSFDGQTRIIYDEFEGLSIIVIGNKNKNFIAAFERKINGEGRTFTAIDQGENIMQITRVINTISLELLLKVRLRANN